MSLQRCTCQVLIPIIVLVARSIFKFTAKVENLVASNMPATFGHWPLGILVSILARLENLFGWIAGLMFVGVVSGFVKKD